MNNIYDPILKIEKFSEFCFWQCGTRTNRAAPGPNGWKRCPKQNLQN